MLSLFEYIYEDDDSQEIRHNYLDSCVQLSSFAVENPKIVQNALAKIQSYLNDEEKQNQALMVLQVVIEQCSSEIFVQYACTWLKQLMKILQRKTYTVSKQLALNITRKILVHLYSFPELRRDTNELSQSIIGNILKSSTDELSKEAMTCLIECMKHFPGACGTIKSQIEKYIWKELMNLQSGVIEEASSCFVLLPICGGSGNKYITQITNWQDQMSKALSTLHLILEHLFEGVEVDVSDYSYGESYSLPDVTSNVCITSFKYSQYFQTLSLCIAKMLSTSYVFKVKVPVEDILSVIYRVIAVNHRMLPKRLSTKISSLSSILPSLHCSVIMILRSLILSCSSLLLPYSESLLKLITQALQQTVCDEKRFLGISKPYSFLRSSVYEAFNILLYKIGVGTNVEKWSDVLVEQILKDIKPEKVVTKLQHCVSLRRSKSKEKKGNVANKDLVTSFLKSETAANHITCKEALTALQALLHTMGTLLKPNIQKEIHQVIMTIVLEIQQNFHNSPVPYNNYQCRYSIYGVLLACLLNSSVELSLPVQTAIPIFSIGQKDKNIKVAEFCALSLAVCNSVMHPQVSAICQSHLPTTSSSFSTNSICHSSPMDTSIRLGHSGCFSNTNNGSDRIYLPIINKNDFECTPKPKPQIQIVSVSSMANSVFEKPETYTIEGKQNKAIPFISSPHKEIISDANTEKHSIVILDEINDQDVVITPSSTEMLHSQQLQNYKNIHDTCKGKSSLSVRESLHDRNGNEYLKTSVPCKQKPLPTILHIQKKEIRENENAKDSYKGKPPTLKLSAHSEHQNIDEACTEVLHEDDNVEEHQNVTNSSAGTSLPSVDIFYSDDITTHHNVNASTDKSVKIIEKENVEEHQNLNESLSPVVSSNEVIEENQNIEHSCIVMEDLNDDDDSEEQNICNSSNEKSLPSEEDLNNDVIEEHQDINDSCSEKSLQPEDLNSDVIEENQNVKDSGSEKLLITAECLNNDDIEGHKNIDDLCLEKLPTVEDLNDDGTEEHQNINDSYSTLPVIEDLPNENTKEHQNINDSHTEKLLPTVEDLNSVDIQEQRNIDDSCTTKILPIMEDRHNENIYTDDSCIQKTLSIVDLHIENTEQHQNINESNSEKLLPTIDDLKNDNIEEYQKTIDSSTELSLPVVEKVSNENIEEHQSIDNSQPVVKNLNDDAIKEHQNIDDSCKERLLPTHVDLYNDAIEEPQKTDDSNMEKSLPAVEELRKNIDPCTEKPLPTIEDLHNIDTEEDQNVSSDSCLLPTVKESNEDNSDEQTRMSKKRGLLADDHIEEHSPKKQALENDIQVSEDQDRLNIDDMLQDFVPCSPDRTA